MKNVVICRGCGNLSKAADGAGIEELEDVKKQLGGERDEPRDHDW